jgi:hypothetical protein
MRACATDPPIANEMAMKAASRLTESWLKRFLPVFALALYSGISVLYFGHGTIPHLSQAYYGVGLDPTIHMWAMSWWPYAISRRLNPLMTPAIWAPAGYNLARAVSIPGPSVIIYPVTRIFGPVVAYNLLCLICPAAAAFAAFWLCRYVCQSFWPALLGGYIFGFSQYVLSQSGGHLFLLFIFPVPLAIYLVCRRLDNALGRFPFVVLVLAVVTFEFLCSTELFAMTTLFGAMALALSLALFTDWRVKLQSVITDVALSYALLIVLVSPYLYEVVAGGIPPVANPPEAYSNDLFAFVVPTVMMLGGNLFAGITAQFRISWGEMAAYLGPGVWLILALFAISFWRTNAGKLLLLSYGLIVIASLGPELHIKGIPRGRLPWAIVDKLPLVDLALPGRFGMYLFLVAALIVAIYLSKAGIPLWSKALLGVCAPAFITPNLAFVQAMSTRVQIPVFFESKGYQRYLSKGDNVLVLPNDATSQTLLWQAQSGFYFHIVTGFYIPPAEYARWPITTSFITSSQIPGFSEQLDAFLGANRVKAIIVDSSKSGPWPTLLSEAGMAGIATGGVLFYYVPEHVLRAFHDTTPHQMAEKEAAVSFGALVVAARRYVDGGFSLAKLSPGEAQRQKLLTLPEGETPPAGGSSWWQNLWLGSWGGLVGVGIVGNYQDLEFLVRDYGPVATDIFFPFPKRLTKRPKRGDGQLLISFTPEGLRRAANQALATCPGLSTTHASQGGHRQMP